MRPLRITNIQRGCVYDGPGVRTTVFLKGCVLRCPWCCNPEAISLKEEWYVDDTKCLLNKGVKSEICQQCERMNGNVHILKCPFGVVEKTHKDYEWGDVAEILLKDKKLYDETKGGVTFSGGEPLLEIDSLVPLLRFLSSKNIHILFETTLLCDYNKLLNILDISDGFIIDLKLQPIMKLNDINYINTLKKHIKVLDRKEIYFRMVFVNDLIEAKSTVLAMLKELNVKKIELLICHNLAENKYQKLSMIHQIYSSDIVMAKEFSSYLTESQIEVSILTI